MTDNEVARQDEVLAALTRILRREATESAIVSTRSRVPTLCADGKVRYAERTETRVVEIPPKISDVNRAADLLGRRCGLWSERTEAAGSDVRIVDDVGAAGPEDGAAERGGPENGEAARRTARRSTAGPENGEAAARTARRSTAGPENGEAAARTARRRSAAGPESGEAAARTARRSAAGPESGEAARRTARRSAARTARRRSTAGPESGKPCGGRRGGGVQRGRKAGKPRRGRRGGGARRGGKVRRQRQGAARAEHPPGGNPYEIHPGEWRCGMSGARLSNQKNRGRDGRRQILRSRAAVLRRAPGNGHV